MDFLGLITKLFGNKAQKDMKAIQPIVDQIKAQYEVIDALSNDELRAHSWALMDKLKAAVADKKSQIANLKSQIETTPIEKREKIYNEVDKLEKEIKDKYEEVLNEILPEAYAIVKSTARRFAESETVEVTATEMDRALAADPRFDFVEIKRNDANDANDANDENAKGLPAFVKGESGPHIPQLKEKTTTPPAYYTEATLLRAMETAGKTVENDELREAMKENGIGRPSTRAAIIEKLYQRKYIVKQGKSLRATETGINLIHTIISPLLKSAELTGLWEKKLREIERGEYAAQDFLNELKEMTSGVVMDVKTNKAGMLCPVCRQGLIIRGNTQYGCSRWREGCTYREPF